MGVPVNKRAVCSFCGQEQTIKTDHTPECPYWTIGPGKLPRREPADPFITPRIDKRTITLLCRVNPDIVGHEVRITIENPTADLLQLVGRTLLVTGLVLNEEGVFVEGEPT